MTHICVKDKGAHFKGPSVNTSARWLLAFQGEPSCPSTMFWPVCRLSWPPYRQKSEQQTFARLYTFSLCKQTVAEETGSQLEASQGVDC